MLCRPTSTWQKILTTCSKVVNNYWVGMKAISLKQWIFKSSHGVPPKLRAVPLSLSPSSETRKKSARKNRARDILGARSTRKFLFLRASRPKNLAQPFFFLASFFRVSLDGLSERGTTRSLGTTGIAPFQRSHWPIWSIFSCTRWFKIEKKKIIICLLGFARQEHISRAPGT